MVSNRGIKELTTTKTWLTMDPQACMSKKALASLRRWTADFPVTKEDYSELKHEPGHDHCPCSSAADSAVMLTKCIEVGCVRWQNFSRTHDIWSAMVQHNTEDNRKRLRTKVLLQLPPRFAYPSSLEEAGRSLTAVASAAILLRMSHANEDVRHPSHGWRAGLMGCLPAQFEEICAQFYDLESDHTTLSQGLYTVAFMLWKYMQVAESMFAVPTSRNPSGLAGSALIMAPCARLMGYLNLIHGEVEYSANGHITCCEGKSFDPRVGDYDFIVWWGVTALLSDINERMGSAVETCATFLPMTFPDYRAMCSDSSCARLTPNRWIDSCVRENTVGMLEIDEFYVPDHIPMDQEVAPSPPRTPEDMMALAELVGAFLSTTSLPFWVTYALSDQIRMRWCEYHISRPKMPFKMMSWRSILTSVVVAEVGRICDVFETKWQTESICGTALTAEEIERCEIMSAIRSEMGVLTRTAFLENMRDSLVSRCDCEEVSARCCTKSRYISTRQREYCEKATDAGVEVVWRLLRDLPISANLPRYDPFDNTPLSDGMCGATLYQAIFEEREKAAAKQTQANVQKKQKRKRNRKKKRKKKIRQLKKGASPKNQKSLMRGAATITDLALERLADEECGCSECGYVQLVVLDQTAGCPACGVE